MISIVLLALIKIKAGTSHDLLEVFAIEHIQLDVRKMQTLSSLHRNLVLSKVF